MAGGKSTKRLRAAQELNQVVAQYYIECNQAKAQGRPVGWMPPMNGAIELFYAMDLQPVFPENWSPVCAAFGLAPGNFETAHNLGYSRDLCGYLRNIIGYVHGDMNGPSVPLGGLPEPDLILSPQGGCVPVMKIFQALERRFPRAAVFRADLPQAPVEDIADHHLAYAMDQMERLVAFLEERTNRRLNLDRLAEVVALSDRACQLWDQLMACRAHRPTPFSAAEIGVMFVMVTRQGTQAAVDFLEICLAEARQRAADGVGVIANEKIRLFWDNIPLWHNMGLFNYFESQGGVVVAETYSAAWSLRLDPGRPMESLARKSLTSYPLVSCVSVKKRIEMVVRACREYHIDGAILHRNKSCAPITLGQMDIKRALAEELDVPSLVIDADHMDAENFSQGQFQTRADAFMEMLLRKKGLN